MTDEEVKKKIEEIALIELRIQFGCGDTVDIGDREACAESIADALIVAGIGDITHLSDYYINELNGAERRIKRAERALEIAEELGELCAPAQNYIEMAKKEFEEKENND